MNGDIEVCGLGLGKSVDSWDVVGDGQVLESSTGVASGVQITDIWTSTIGVDLVNSDLNSRAGSHLSDSLGGKLVLGVLADIDVSRKFSTSALIDNVGVDLSLSDDGGILLTWADASAVSGQSLVH